VYLRARYYVPGLGVFPSLDPVEEGNRYGYVGGNVVNRVDPSGMVGESPERWDSCISQIQIQGCCGPDATKWIYQEMMNHYHYAKNELLHLRMGDFRKIFERVIKGPVVSGFEAFQLASYGLAVDYKYIDYQLLERASNLISGGASAAPNYSCSDTTIISVCDRCQSSSDYGNLILGIVIAAAGESLVVAKWAGDVFNSISGDPSAGADNEGVILGHILGNIYPFELPYSRFQFCTLLRSLGTGWFDQINPGCQTPSCGIGNPNLDNAGNSVPYWDCYVSKTILGGNNPDGFGSPSEELLSFLPF